MNIIGKPSELALDNFLLQVGWGKIMCFWDHIFVIKQIIFFCLGLKWRLRHHLEPQPEEDDLCLGVAAWPPVGTPDRYLKHTRFREIPEEVGLRWQSSWRMSQRGRQEDGRATAEPQVREQY